jgi:hypothetical protein
MAEKKKSAPRVKQPSAGDYLRTLGDMLVVNPRNSPAATLGGAAYDYATRSTPQSVVRDIRNTAQDAGDWLRKQNKALRANPVTGALQLLKAGYIDPLADPFRVFQQAATERSRGNEAGGKKLAAMVPLAVAGVVNPELRGAGKLAVKAGVDAATKTAKKAATPSVKVTPEASEKPRFSAKQEGPFLRVNREGAKRQTVPEAREAKNLEEIRVILQDPSKNTPAQAADEYMRATLGRGYDLNMPAPSTSLQKQSGIARVFQEAVEGSPEYKQRLFEAYGSAMPEVVEQAGAQNYDQLTEAAYRQLAEEARAQFDALPVQTSYSYGAGEYATPSDMLRDVLGEGNLNVFRGGEPHEFLSEVDPDTDLTANEMFRAVHDLYGHGTRGATFRPGGEELAYASHSQMMSPLAQMALLAETRGQNSLVNYSPLNVKPIGEMRDIMRAIDEEKTYLRRRGEQPRPGQFDAENARLRELGATFVYAPQKGLLLPPEYLDVNIEGGVPEYLRDVIKARAPSAPERAVHLSHTEGLAATDPAFYGTGHRGDDFAVRGQKGSPREHTSFYLGPEGTVIPEAVVEDISPYAYETELSGLYDIGSDPEGLVALARAYRLPLQSAIPDFNRMVREYGYRGYRNAFGPQDAANVFDAVKLQRRIQKGPRGFAEGGTVEG